MSAYPEPIRRDYAMADGTMSAIHFGRVQNPLKVVFLHANGFNGYVYKDIFEALGVHALALDLRGHGFTHLPKNIDRLTNFYIFRDDVVEFFNRHIDRPVVLGGHSLGAVSGILAAPKIQDKLNGYVGFDPVSLPGSARLLLSVPGGRSYAKKHFALARNAGRRKSAFESHDEAFARYKNRGAFQGVPDQILRDYLTGGLALGNDGAYHLCCDPSWEQAVFVAQNHNLYKAVHALPDNSHIIYAGKFNAVSTARTRGVVQKNQPNMTVSFDKDLEHLFPLQEPNLAAQILQGTLAQASYK
ncbi:MAG: alpha/beta fold hydrolase [Litorimonas sp.]